MSGSYLRARCAHPLCARGQFHSKNTRSPHPHPGGEGASPKAERSNGPPGFAPNPVGLGRGAQVSADQGWHMSERSELCETALKSSTAGGTVAQGRGPRLRGAFSCLLLLAKQRTSASPAGASPGPHPQQNPITPADGAAHVKPSTAPAPHAYKSSLLKYPHAPAASAPPADPRHGSANASQMHGAACVGTAAR